MHSGLISKLAIATSVSLVAGLLLTPAESQAPATQPPTSQWQIDAGGQAKFDVASVKLSKPDSSYHANVPMDSRDWFEPTGGLLSANVPLTRYIVFAYKLTEYEDRNLLPPQLPKWANIDKYDIEARATGNPTKDQFRLMMQGLLADRFKLAVHHETRQLPVFALVLDKPGTLGPGLRPHSDDPPCAGSPGGPSLAPVGPSFVGGFPTICGGISGEVVNGHDHFGGRSLTMAQIADVLSGAGWDNLGRPVLDQTGLGGNFDFSIEYTPQFNGPAPDGLFDPAGPTYVEALKEQLGLKLEPKTAPVDVLVIDHIEQPSAN